MLSGQLAPARMLDPAEPLRVVLERPVHCTEPYVSHLQSERAGSDELNPSQPGEDLWHSLMDGNTKNNNVFVQLLTFVKALSSNWTSFVISRIV